MTDQSQDGDNRFDGEADNSVQGRNFYGDVNFHNHAPAPEQSKQPPSQVPTPSDCYTNNDRQLREITDAVAPGENADSNPDQPARVMVVQGVPGGGKSETAYQWVHEHREHYPDGLFYASLAAGTAETGLESEALRHFLVSVGYSPDSIPATLQDRSGWFLSWSTGKRIVVVLDDAISASQVRSLTPGLGCSAVLATEARPLGALRARGGAKFVELDPMSDDSARLLLARIVDGSRELDGESEQVDELVRLCAGSTIALCVAGSLLAQFPTRPVARLVRQLSREGRRLEVLSRDEDLSVTAVLNTAVQRLDEFTRQVYLAFGQHPGTGDVGPDALAAALREDPDDIQDALDDLLTARLLRETPDGRYVVDTLIREHAGQYFADDPIAPVLRERFDGFYTLRALAAGHAQLPQRGWLERLWPELLPELPSLPNARAWLDAERANLRAVVARRFETGSDEVCRLAVALWPFHEHGKHVEDMDAVNEQAAALAEEQGFTFARGLALVQRGFAFRHRGELDKAAELFSAAEALAGEHGPYDLRATALESLGLARRDQEATDDARELLARNLDMALELGQPRRVALARLHLGSVQEAETALVTLDEAVRGFREQPDDEYNVAKALLWRGRKLTELRRCDEAPTALNESMRIMESRKRHFDVAQVHHAFGEWALVVGDEVLAREHFTGAVAICRAHGFAEQAERAQARLLRLDELSTQS